MRFQVPQFIEHEARVIGPLTFRQFVYLGVPGAVAFFLYFLAPFFVFVVAAIFLGGLGFVFAFIKIGGRNLPSIMLNFFNFTMAPKRYIWKKGLPAVAESDSAKAGESSVRTDKTPEGAPKREIQLAQKSKLRDLATRVETTR